MCYRTKSKVSDLLTCVPKSTRFGINTSVTMWQDRVCDGTPHCLHGQDEESCYTDFTGKSNYPLLYFIIPPAKFAGGNSDPYVRPFVRSSVRPHL